MKTVQHIKYIEKILECFFEGVTTGAEEKMLYAFFRSNDVPEHLLKYKPLFDYIENEMPAELEECMELDAFATQQGNKRIHWKRWARISVAASLFLLIAVGTLMTHVKPDFNPYEGSYIVRNGVRITDPKQIETELEYVLKTVMEVESKAEALLANTDNTLGTAALLEVQIEDSEKQILNEFTNEYVKEEVRKILND